MRNTSHSLLNYFRVMVESWRDDPREDATLLTRFAEDGDETAFRVLVGRHGPLVWQTCRRILGDTPDAEDAFQTTFLILARKASRLRREPLAGWLHRVARRAALNADAGARRRRSLQQQLGIIKQREEEAAEANRAELYTALDEELASLPERLRVPLLLHYLEGRSQVEVARFLGCARSALQKRLTQGEAILRERLERRGLAVGIGMVTALLTSSVTASAVPARLIGSTARAAVAFRSGGLTGGAAEAARAVLVALPASLEATIIRKSLWIVLACSLGLTGAGLVTCRALSALPDEPGGVGPAATQAPSQSGAGGRTAARIDCFGDPLPVGALARMGTVRQWYGRLGFTPNPTILAFLPDGKTLVSQKEGGSFCGESVCLWDAATGREIRRITTDPGTYALTLLALSPDGRTLVTGKKGTVYLWEMATGKLLHKWAYQKPTRNAIFLNITGITFLPNGKILTLDNAGNSDNRMYLWDVATGGKEISQLNGQGKDLDIVSQTVAFSPDGKMMAAVSDGTNGHIIHVWEVATSKKIHQLQLPGEKERPVRSVAFSPDGKTLAAGGSGIREICVWEVATGKLIHQFEAGGSGFSCPLAYSPDGKTLLGGSHGHLWDVATGKEIRLFGWENAKVAVFSPTGKILAVGDQAGVIRLWEVATGKEILPHKGHQDRVTSIAYSPDGKTLASASDDNTVRLWEVATGKEMRPLAKHVTRGSGSLAYSPDGKMLASMDNEVIHLWDTVTGKEIRQFQGKERPQSVTFSPDGKLLAATVGDHTVCLWQVATGKQIYTLSREVGGGASESWSVAFSPDGRLLAAPGKENTVSLWEVATGQLIDQLAGPKPLAGQEGRLFVQFLAFSPDGRLLATSSKGDEKIRVWETATGKEICQLDSWQVHGRKICPDGYTLAFSPDSRVLATAAQGANYVDGSLDPKVHLWEVASGKEIGQLSGHRSTVRSVAFSPDGKTLASGSDDLTCLIWDLTLFARRLKSALAPPLILQALPKERLEAAWADLVKDPAQAYAAIRALQAASTQAIPLLQARLRPVTPADPQQLKRWIADLDDNSFAVRDKAQREIKKLGEPAIAALRQALKGRPALEVKRRLQALLAELEPKMVVVSPNRLRELRAVHVLESIGTVEARQVLQALAKGVTEARLTREAQAALARLAKRSAAKP